MWQRHWRHYDVTAGDWSTAPWRTVTFAQRPHNWADVTGICFHFLNTNNCRNPPTKRDHSIVRAVFRNNTVISENTSFQLNFKLRQYPLLFPLTGINKFINRNSVMSGNDRRASATYQNYPLHIYLPNKVHSLLCRHACHLNHARAPYVTAPQTLRECTYSYFSL